MLLLLLYCTGLRFGEAVRLLVGDVDQTRHALLVRASKGKTRVVPFRADLAREIEGYRRLRARVASENPTSPFLVQPKGHAYSPAVASVIVRQLLRRTGIKPPTGRQGPRPYDFRHTFAVHRLASWYRSGSDVPARLPWLSTYMGHDDLLGTEDYLSATPEILALVARKFRDIARPPGARS